MGMTSPFWDENGGYHQVISRVALEMFRLTIGCRFGERGILMLSGNSARQVALIIAEAISNVKRRLDSRALATYNDE